MNALVQTLDRESAAARLSTLVTLVRIAGLCMDDAADDLAHTSSEDHEEIDHKIRAIADELRMVAKGLEAL